MTKMLARALLAAGTLAIVSAVSAPAEAAYKHRHVTAHRFGHYLAWRHFHHYHRDNHIIRFARHEPAFMQRRSNCLFSHGHLRWCIQKTARHVPLIRAAAFHGYDRGEILPHPAGCPARLFCGCGAAIEAFGRSIRDLWLVDNWLRFPRSEPANGMAVVWPHRHVAVIREYLGKGVALLYDANSGGGLTRLHRRSIAGLVVVDPHPGRVRGTYKFAGAAPL